MTIRGEEKRKEKEEKEKQMTRGTILRHVDCVSLRSDRDRRPDGERKADNEGGNEGILKVKLDRSRGLDFDGTLRTLICAILGASPQPPTSVRPTDS